MTQPDYKQIDLSQWIKVGEGGNGSTFENRAVPYVLLKLNNDRSNVRYQLNSLMPNFSK